MPKPDAYTWKARVAPVLLVVSPALVFMATSAILQVKVAFGGATLTGVLTVVAAELGRDRGTRLEAGLWESWGGAPSVRRLRFRSGEPERVIADRHRVVTKVTGRPLATKKQEEADPAAADQQYSEGLSVLRELTRDASKFKLLQAENASYGFRRNTLGLRWWGIASSAVVSVGSVVFFALASGTLAHRLGTAGPAAVWSVGMLALFGFVVDPDWVRTPADAYADRLLGAAEVLAAA